MLPDYEIVIGRGIGQILFGMTKDELAGVLGPPDETYEPEDLGKSTWETYSYNAIKCSFSFNPAFGDRLVEIAVENGYFHILHKVRVGLGKEEMLRVGVELNLGSHVIEDVSNEEFPSRISLGYHQVGLILYLDDGIISLIQISPLFNPDHSITWPE